MAEQVLDVRLDNVKDKLEGIESALNSSKASIKDWKAQIDALKASMLQMDSTSEEYTKTLKTVTEMQDKLNKVNKDTKSGYQAVEGSLNAMRKTLSDMTKDLNNNYVVGTKAYDEMAKKVNAFADSIKAAEAQQGVFFRNVGNYTNSALSALQQMGLPVGNLQKSFQMATLGANGFGKALNVLKAHPFIAVASALVAIFLALKNRMEDNEKASNKWKQAMSAFQPIIIVFQKVIGYLVEALADVALWLAEKTPKAMSVFAKAVNVGINIAKFFVNAWFAVPTAIGKILDTVVNGATKAFSKIAETASKVADFIGLDKISKGLKSMADASANFTSGIGKGMDAVKNKVLSVYDTIGKTVTDTFDKMGKATTSAMGREKERQRLVEEGRKNDEKSAESQLKQQQLRDKIAKASGEERLKLQKQLADEVRADGERQVKYAKDQLAYAEKMASLSPNSKATNDELSKLRANVLSVSASTEATMAGVDKMITRTENSIEKASEKATEKLKKEIKTREQIVKEFIDSYNMQMSKLGTNSKNDQTALDQQKEMLEAYGKYSVEEQKKYEDERHRIKVEELNAEIKLTEETLNNSLLTENEKLKLQQKHADLLVSKVEEDVKHQINLAKNAKTEIDNTFSKTNSNIDINVNSKKQDATNQYSNAMDSLGSQYDSGAISSKEYLEQSKQLEIDYQKALADIDMEGQRDRVEALRQHFEDLSFEFGNDSEIALQAYADYQKAQTDLQIEEQKKRDEARKGEISKDQENKEKRLKLIKDYAKSSASLMGTVADAWQDELKAKVENGEMSEREAKKQFEITKALQYGQTVISTAMGIQGAIASVSDMGPVGWALGAIQAATILASGIQQMNTIKNTKFGSDSSSVSNSNGGIMSASVNPLLDEVMDSQSLSSLTAQNISDKNSNTRVWISQTDLEDSHTQVEVRNTNSTF